MAVERLTSLSAGVLADRADRELAEIVEALGLLGSLIVIWQEETSEPPVAQNPCVGVSRFIVAGNEQEGGPVQADLDRATDFRCVVAVEAEWQHHEQLCAFDASYDLVGVIVVRDADARAVVVNAFDFEDAFKAEAVLNRFAQGLQVVVGDVPGHDHSSLLLTCWEGVRGSSPHVGVVRGGRVSACAPHRTWVACRGRVWGWGRLALPRYHRKPARVRLSRACAGPRGGEQ